MKGDYCNIKIVMRERVGSAYSELRSTAIDANSKGQMELLISQLQRMINRPDTRNESALFTTGKKIKRSCK